jgi:mannose-6-phosphate isomerase-like protein (cupin superfamily)
MKKFIVAIIALMISITSIKAQTKINVIEFQPKEDFDNIHVVKLTTDSLASSFLIWVKKSVKAHKHEKHTENLYVLSGKGIMKVGQEEFEISAGDYLKIPMNTVHSVKVISDEPLKVISVQAPEFTGKDRVFVDEK